MEGLKLVTLANYNKGNHIVSLYHCPEIASHLERFEAHTSKTLEEIFSFVDIINKLNVLRFPADSETPTSYFWNNIHKNGCLILASDIYQFLLASRLQYKLKRESRYNSSLKN